MSEMQYLTHFRALYLAFQMRSSFEGEDFRSVKAKICRNTLCISKIFNADGAEISPSKPYLLLLKNYYPKAQISRQTSAA